MARDFEFLDGAEFILDAPQGVQARWGNGDDVLWARGESMFLNGPPGVGKTTIISQLTLGMLGIRSQYLLGYRIEEAQRLLYLASDRPRQISRLFQRLVGEEHRDILKENLVVWKGPPPQSIAKDNYLLVEMARAAEADVVILDSLKDMATGLTEDDIGASVNIALQRCLAEDIDVGVSHHNRKAGNMGAKPKTLEDVYGSAFLTAGAGSVICLYGKAGDEIVEMIHLKQPASPVGPLMVEHDHENGVSRIHKGSDLLGILRASPGGSTIEALAMRLYDSEKPTAAEKKRVERQLAKAEKAGKAHHSPQTRSGGIFVPARWHSSCDETDME